MLFLGIQMFSKWRAFSNKGSSTYINARYLIVFHEPLCRDNFLLLGA